MSDTSLQTCPACGEQNQTSDLFCGKCGHPLTRAAGSREAEPSAPAPTAKRGNSQKSCAVAARIKSVTFVRNCVLVALSILLFVGFFLPVVRADGYQTFGVDGADIYFTPKDNIVFFFDSLHNKTSEKLSRDRIYRETLAAEEDFLWSLGFTMDDLGGSMGNLEDLIFAGSGTTEVNLSSLFPDGMNRHQTRAMQRYFILGTRLALRSEQTPFAPSYLTAALASLLYFLLACACLIFSVLNLVTYLLGRRSYFRLTARLLAAAPGACLLLYVMARVLLGGADPALGIAAPAVVCIVVPAVVLFALAGLGCAARRGVRVLGGFSRAVSLVCASLMIGLIALSPLSSKITAVFTGETEKTSVNAPLSWGVFEEMNMRDEEYDLIDKNPTTIFDSLAGYRVTQLWRGNADGDNCITAAVSVLWADDAGATRAFAWLPVLAFLMGLAAVGMMTESFAYFILGRDSKVLQLIYKISGCVFAVFLVVALASFVITGNVTLDNSALKDMASEPAFADVVGENGVPGKVYRMRIGASMIVAALLSIAALAMPLLGDRRKQYAPAACTEAGSGTTPAAAPKTRTAPAAPAPVSPAAPSTPSATASNAPSATTATTATTATAATAATATKAAAPRQADSHCQ